MFLTRFIKSIIKIIGLPKQDEEVKLVFFITRIKDPFSQSSSNSLLSLLYSQHPVFGREVRADFEGITFENAYITADTLSGTFSASY